MYYVYLLLLWASIYYKGQAYVKSPSYITSIIHTSMVLLMLTYSITNMKYVIPWSQSYFLFDSILSTYVLTRPVIINNYHAIIKTSQRIPYKWSYIGYVIHHGMSLYALEHMSDYKQQGLYTVFTNLYYHLECSNVLLYGTYFVFQRFGKKHIASFLALTLEICGYGYIRIIILMQYITQYWYLFDMNIRLFITILYILGVIWIRQLLLQYKLMIDGVQDVFF